MSCCRVEDADRRRVDLDPLELYTAHVMSSRDHLIDKLQAWSYLRQQLNRAASGPAEALRGVVAVYSSHPTAPLSLLSRSASFDAEHLSEMEQRREVLRIPAMRQSIFLVPAETAPRLSFGGPAINREPTVL